MGSLRFRGTSSSIGELGLHVDPQPGCGWWLFDADRSPELLYGDAHDLSSLPSTLEIDNRSLDEMLERLTGACMTYWPPGTTPQGLIGDVEHTRLNVVPGSSPGHVRIVLDAALVPDFNDPDVEVGPTHRLELSGDATLVREPPNG